MNKKKLKKTVCASIAAMSMMSVLANTSVLANDDRHYAVATSELASAKATPVPAGAAEIQLYMSFPFSSNSYNDSSTGSAVEYTIYSNYSPHDAVSSSAKAWEANALVASDFWS
jgi:hypothetical protein